MKKKYLLSSLFLISLASLFATPFDEIMESALNENSSYKNQIVSYEKGLLNLEKLDLKDESAITVGVTANPVLNTSSMAQNLGFSGSTVTSGIHEYGIMVTPAVNAVLKDNKTTLGFSMPYLVDYNGKANILKPSVSAGYAFNFSEYDDSALDDINYAITKYSTEYAYSSAKLALKKNVINSISSILTVEKNIKDAEKKLSDTEKTLDEYKKLSTYSEDSIAFIAVQTALDSYKTLLSTYNETLSNAKAAYKSITGLEWTGLDSIPEPVLEIKALANGNTEVLLSSLKVGRNEEIYNKAVKEYDVNVLNLKGSASGDINMLNKVAGSLALQGTLEYKGNNWALSANPGGTWTYGDSKTDFTPSLTLSASWTNNTKAKASELDKRDKLLDITSAENDYSASLTQYSIEAQQYSSKITSWNLKRADRDANMRYLEAVLENKRALFDAGIIRESEVKDAEYDLESAKSEYQLMLLEGLALQCDLELFAL